MPSIYSKDSFDRFGDDLCEVLLSYLPFKDRFRYECISSQWQRKIFTTQSDLIIDGNLIGIADNQQILALMVKKLANITRVCGDNRDVRINESVMAFIIENCIHMTDIDVNMWPISGETFNRFFAKFAKQLKTFRFKQTQFDYRVLSVHGVQFSRGVNIWRQMCVNFHSFNDTLDFSYISSHLIDGQNEMRFKRLQDIQLVVNHSTDDFNAFNIFANIYKNNIKTIGFEFNCDFNEDIVNKLSDGLSKMKRLIDLNLVFQLKPKNLSKLLSRIGLKCPQLKSLRIISFCSTFEPIFETICTSFKRLKRLKVSAALKEEPKLITDSLKTLKRLTHFEMSTCFLFTDQFFVDISSHLPLIQHLVVNHVKITSVALEALLKLKHMSTGRLCGFVDRPGTALLDQLPVGFTFVLLKPISVLPF